MFFPLCSSLKYGYSYWGFSHIPYIGEVKIMKWWNWTFSGKALRFTKLSSVFFIYNQGTFANDSSRCFLVELALARLDSKDAGVSFCVCVCGHQLRRHAPNRSWRRPWKLGIRMVTTFVVCKWVSWWACGLFLAMNEMTYVSWLRFCCLAMMKFSPNRGPWFSCYYARVLWSKYPE